MPLELADRASALVPMIVVLPENTLDIDGASFDRGGAIVVFEARDDNNDEEALTVLHEIGHVLDPGWEQEALATFLNRELRCHKKTRQLLERVGEGVFEGFAELAAWEMAGMSEVKKLPWSSALVHTALYWKN